MTFNYVFTDDWLILFASRYAVSSETKWHTTCWILYCHSPNTPILHHLLFCIFPTSVSSYFCLLNHSVYNVSLTKSTNLLFYFPFGWNFKFRLGLLGLPTFLEFCPHKYIFVIWTRYNSYFYTLFAFYFYSLCLLKSSIFTLFCQHFLFCH